MQPRRVPLIAALGVCAILAATALVLMFRSLALAGDGSFYLVRVLGEDRVFGPDPRIFLNAIRQAPVLVADDTGLTDTRRLTLLFGFGQLVLPALAWAMAVIVARTDDVVFAAVSMTAGLCAGSTWFFSVNESVLAVPLTILVAVLLWLPHDWGWRHAGLAAATSVVLVASYEATALTGALLGAWAAWRALSTTCRVDMAGSVFVSAASLLSAIVGVAGSQDTTGRPGRQAFLYHLVSVEPWPLFLALCGIWLLVVGLFLRARVLRLLTLAGGGLAVITSALGQEVTNALAYNARSGTNLAGVVLVLFLWWQWIAARRGAYWDVAGTKNLAPALTIIVVALLVAPSIVASDSWAQSLKAFQAQVARAEGVVLAEEVLPAERQDVLFDWTSPSLSLIVRNRPTDAILVDRGPSFVPFPPTSAREQLSDDYVWR